MPRFLVQALILSLLSLTLHHTIGTPVNNESGYRAIVFPSVVEYFEKIGGSITENPFPVPTIVRSIHLEYVQISDDLLGEMLANCLQVEGFVFKPYDQEHDEHEGARASAAGAHAPIDEYTFDLALISRMKGHHFNHFILHEVVVNFNAPSPINADLLVTFYESTLPPDFTTGLKSQFPTVNTLNLVQIDVAGAGHGVRAEDLEFLLSGAIPSLRHMFIRDFNWAADGDGGARLRSIFEGLGCPGVTGHVFLDKDYDRWEC